MSHGIFESIKCFLYICIVSRPENANCVTFILNTSIALLKFTSIIHLFLHYNYTVLILLTPQY